MKQHSREYTDYIKSDKWRARCNELRAKRGSICERCGSDVWIEVHHLTYDRLGDELDDDLQIVCHACHPQVDKEREQREADRAFQKRADAWAAKVYGHDWRDTESPDNVIDAFYEWIQNKEQEQVEWVTM